MNSRSWYPSPASGITLEKITGDNSHQAWLTGVANLSIIKKSSLKKEISV